jgi:hypothetical protein
VRQLYLFSIIPSGTKKLLAQEIEIRNHPVLIADVLFNKPLKTIRLEMGPLLDFS